MTLSNNPKSIARMLWRAKNPERDLATSRRYFANHREEVLERNRQRKLANPELFKQYSKNDRERNAARIKEYQNRPERKESRKVYNKQYRLEHYDAYLKQQKAYREKQKAIKNLVKTFIRELTKQLKNTI